MRLFNTDAQATLFDDQDEKLTPAAEFQQESNKRFLDELFENVSSYRSTNSYSELLSFVRRFHFYSPFNAMLVHIQKPGARYVLPAHKWRTRYQRTIRPGAQPLVILQPFGPVMFVFDVSETEGAPLPAEIESPFRVRRGRVDDQLQRTIRNAVRDGIRIRQVPHGSGQAGSIGPTRTANITLTFDNDKEVPLRYEMLLNANHDETVQFSTLAHELGHLYCGHLGTPDRRWWSDRRGLSLEQIEFEAESVAWLVCQRIGIEPTSDQYLSGYLQQDGEIPHISVDRVMTAAGLIEQMGEKKLKMRKPR